MTSRATRVNVENPRDVLQCWLFLIQRSVIPSENLQRPWDTGRWKEGEVSNIPPTPRDEV